MTDTKLIHKAAGILVKDRRLLVEKSFNKDFFIAPGGKIQGDETPKQALRRELKEEFSIEVVESNLDEFGTFIAEAAGKNGVTVEMQVFVVAGWEGEPVASSEVEDIAWITSEYGDMPVGSIFAKEVIPRLKDQNLID